MTSPFHFLYKAYCFVRRVALACLMRMLKIYGGSIITRKKSKLETIRIKAGYVIWCKTMTMETMSILSFTKKGLEFIHIPIINGIGTPIIEL